MNHPMSEETTTATPPATSVWQKLIYSFIALLWIVAGLVVYFTFVSDRTPQTSKSETAALDPQYEAQVDEDQKAIVFNAEGEQVDAEQAKLLPLKLPEFSLTNQSGETIGLEELKGKPWVGTFVFSSCPGPCGLITGKMKQLQQDLDDVDFNLVSITVDPENDDPEKLTKYADAFTADLDNWHFLTGDRQVIYSLIRSGFKMPVGEVQPGNVIHSNKFVVVDEDGNYVASYLGLNDEEFHDLKKYVRELVESQTEENSNAEEPNSADEDDGQES
jgi:protein SCO1/2